MFYSPEIAVDFDCELEIRLKHDISYSHSFSSTEYEEAKLECKRLANAGHHVYLLSHKLEVVMLELEANPNVVHVQEVKD